ncbi:Scr1 family TA system antitoxin-like transcriptional regulator [Micromonospora echinospora]
MHPQLDHLVTTAARATVIVHIVPVRAGIHPGLARAFVVAGFDGRDDVGHIDDRAAGRVAEDVAPLLAPGTRCGRWRSPGTSRSS